MSPLGHEQATKVARWLEAEPVEAIWSSTMRRAVQTAEPLAAKAGHKIREHAGIVEFDQAAATYIPTEEEWKTPNIYEDNPVGERGKPFEWDRQGVELPEHYDYRYLPMARLTKAYSLALNAVGRHGPVPEGMGATTALRSRWLDERHGAVKDGVLRQVDAFRAERGYEPPYWKLVEMARSEARAADARSGSA